MQMSVDSIEAGIAVLIGCDDESIRMTVPIAHLPHGTSEGDILVLTFVKDPDSTAGAKERIARKIEFLKKKQAG
ncbi:MAG: DUF3006 domain-containing protein [Methanoregula sp.]|jgi:hypothetical protein|nr:DUF3006 domain-containing protein [Methanoregula sp.]